MIPPHCWLVLPAVSDSSVEFNVGVGLGVAATVTDLAATTAGESHAFGRTAENEVARPQEAPASKTSRRAVGSSQ